MQKKNLTFTFLNWIIDSWKGKEKLCKKTLCLWSQIPTSVPRVRPRLDKYFKMIIQLELDRKNKFSRQLSFCSNFLFIVLGEGRGCWFMWWGLNRFHTHWLFLHFLCVRTHVCACVKATHYNITWVKPCCLPGGVKPWICNSSKQAVIVTTTTAAQLQNFNWMSKCGQSWSHPLSQYVIGTLSMESIRSFLYVGKEQGNSCDF